MSQEAVWRYLQEVDPSRFDGNDTHVRWLFGAARKKYGPSFIHVLNIGIGSARLERICHKHGWSVHSLDIVSETVARLQAEGIDAKCGSIDQIPFSDDSMDVIFCAEVLEHLTEDARNKGLSEIRRVLRPGGMLIGSVPYRENLSKQITVCPSCSTAFNWADHRKSFAPDTLREELAVHGLKVKKVYLSNFIDLAKEPWIRRLLLVPFWLLGRNGRGFTPITCGFMASK